MRCTSMWQPWAELARRGLKVWETRGFRCDSGPIAIHAAQRKFRDEDLTREARFQMLKDEVDPFTLAYGVVLFIAEIVEVVRVEEIRDSLSERERLYGNYDNGRFAWRLANIRSLPKPVSLKGKQGWYDWAEARLVMREQGLL